MTDGQAGTQEPAFHAFKAIACDYDRTLTDEALNPSPEALDALGRLHTRVGVHAIVISGRPLAFLRERLHAQKWVSAIVADNGGVVHLTRTSQTLRDSRLMPSIRRALIELAIETVHSDAMIDCDARHEPLVRQALQGAGVQADIVRNRDRIMILPPGIDKALGLQRALSLLGLTVEDAVCIGDGENDAVMLKRAGYGIAVANAVPAAKAVAMHVSTQPGGLGVAEVCERWLAEVTTPLRPDKSSGSA